MSGISPSLQKSCNQNLKQQKRLHHLASVLRSDTDLKELSSVSLTGS